jgi:putative flippase GtrA
VTVRDVKVFATFVAVNVLNTALYYLLYLLLLHAVPYLVANLLALTLAIFVAYFANARFAFRVETSRRSLALFAVSNLMTMCLRTAAVWFLVELLAVGERPAPLIAAVITLPIAYLLTSLALGRRPDRGSPPARLRAATDSAATAGFDGQGIAA